MKKCLIVFLMLALVTSFVFADVISGLTNANNKATTNLELNLDGDAYQIGFSTNPNFTSASSINLEEVIDISAGTVRLNVQTFYFFYKAITDDPNVMFQISVTPMYLNATKPEDTDTEKDKKTINFTVNINQTAVWNGATFSDTLATNGTASSTPSKLKADTFKDYLTNGIAGVVISSGEALEGKIPGSYTGTITVTLSSTS